MHVSLLPLSLLVARALADGAAIVAAMQTISSATVALNSTVSSFPNNPLLDLLDVGPLLTDSITLLNDINSATYIAQQSANLTLSEAISVAQSTLSLASIVESTLTNIVNSKSKFDKLVVVSPVILLNLKLEMSATDAFGAAVVEKVPAALQATARNLLAPIDDAFNSAIAAFE
jgi:Hydrophobic surface binding protein A